MSRIGKEPVKIPKGVKVQLAGNKFHVEGPKGKLDMDISPLVTVEVSSEAVKVKRSNDEKPTRSLHGTVRAHINNMITGVTEGFKKDLDIIGVGFKAQIKGKTLVLNVGFTHPVEMPIPEGLKVSSPILTHITIEGCNRYMVGQFTANVRAVLPPEPYKGKGIRYTGEEVRKKLGKALAK
jgi:large subunit ribosomal protein L6